MKPRGPLAKAVRRIDVSRFPIPLRLAAEGPSLLIEMETRERDSGAPFLLKFRVPLEPFYLARASRDVIAAEVRAQLRRLLLHELDEHLRFDGERRWGGEDGLHA